MGLMWARHVSAPDTTPDGDFVPSFDPSLGFPNGRKPREMIATEEEMTAAKLPLIRRDYCAHEYLKLAACRTTQYPRAWRCKHEHHVYAQCQLEDYVIRMKEYEREKRLLERQKRREQAVAA